MSGNMLIVPYNDFDDASLSVNVTLPDGFDVTNLQNIHRGDVLLTSDNSDLVITGVWPEDRTINSAWLLRHNLHGANWQLQLFSDAGASSAVSGGDSSSNPALYYTADEPYAFSKGSNDPFQYLAAARYLYASDKTARSFKITVSGTPSAAAYYEIGRVFIGRGMTLPINPAFGAQLGLADLSRANRTEGGTRTGRTGEKYRTWKGDLQSIDPLYLGVWMQIMNTAGTSRDVMMSLFPGDGTSRERWNEMNCFMSSLDPLGFQVGRFTKTLQFEEA